MAALERGMIWLASVTPTPTPEESFDPNDVTPGPIGFFATVFLFVAVGLIAMSLMRRSARVQERWAIREQLEAEAAAEDAAAAASADGRDTRADSSGVNGTQDAGAGESGSRPPKAGK